MSDFTFYYTVASCDIRPFMPEVAVLFPASSFVNETKRRGLELKVPRVPSQLTTLAADCGGFVATFRWGDYRYTPDQYVEWLDAWRPGWAAMMDYCCEDEITSGRPGVVRERQDRTTAMAHHFWSQYRDLPFTWVPTIQGWQVEDYRHHARELVPLIQEMYAYYQERDGEQCEFRVGLGTLCRRANISMIVQVVLAVAELLPDVPLHLWGVKLGVFQGKIALPQQIVSADSAAWNGLFGSDLEIYKEYSRTLGYTQREYIWKIALPSYEKKLNEARRSPKQRAMF